MAAVTPTTITKTNLGSMDCFMYELPATTDNTNTIATGIPNIRFAFASQQDTAGTATSQGVGVSWSGEDLTVHVGEDNAKMIIMVLAGGA